MQTIVIASQKGGAGKTTLVRHLAVEAESAQDGPVAIIDCDPHSGLSKWWNRRQDESPVLIQSPIEELEQTVTKLERTGFRHVIIDTPPAIGLTIRKVIRLANLVVIPAIPSPDDLDAVGDTIDLAESEGRAMVFVINNATRRARLTAQAAITLSQHGTVAPTVIHHSVMFPTSAIGGLTVREVDPDSKPAQEITELWAYISERLRRTGEGRGGGLQASKPAEQMPLRLISEVASKERSKR